MYSGTQETTDTLNCHQDITNGESSLYLIAFGIGTCWDGYERAQVVRLGSKESAESLGCVLATQYRAQLGLRYREGCSYIVEKVSGDLAEMPAFKHRLKPEAQQECLNTLAVAAQNHDTVGP